MGAASHWKDLGLVGEVIDKLSEKWSKFRRMFGDKFGDARVVDDRADVREDSSLRCRMESAFAVWPCG